MHDFTLALDPIIALFYYLCALLFAGGLTIDGMPKTPMLIAKIGVVAFFLGCGVDHADMFFHGLQGSPMDYATFHTFLPKLAQVLGAAAFLFVALNEQVSIDRVRLRSPFAHDE